METIPAMPLNPKLAFAYIMYQDWCDELYDPKRGLIAGTIFPELNQPMSEYDLIGGGRHE